MPRIIHTPTLILGAGLSGTGKTAHLKKLAASISNSVYLDKDTTVGGMLGDKPYFTEFYWQNIHFQSYEVLWRLGQDNLKSESPKVVILDAYYGDKTAMIKRALESGVRVLVAHFYCSKEKEHARILSRNDELRDHDKFSPEAFEAFYQKGIQSQTETLAQVPAENIIHIDTENDASLNQNIQKILEVLEGPSSIYASLFRSALQGFTMALLPELVTAAIRKLGSYSQEGTQWIKPAVSYFCVLMMGSWKALLFSLLLEQVIKRTNLLSNSSMRLAISTVAFATTVAENLTPRGFGKIVSYYAGGQLALWAASKTFKGAPSETRPQ